MSGCEGCTTNIEIEESVICMEHDICMDYIWCSQECKMRWHATAQAQEAKEG